MKTNNPRNQIGRYDCCPLILTLTLILTLVMSPANSYYPQRVDPVLGHRVCESLSRIARVGRVCVKVL